MNCPYCKNEMVLGRIDQDRYAIKWVPEEKSKGILNFTPFVTGIKLTSYDTGSYVKAYYCSECRKFIINQDPEDC